MDELEEQQNQTASVSASEPPPAPVNSPPPPPPENAPPPPPPFDPTRMVGIIKRKALIKELAAAYHSECLTYCQELLELQRNWEESIVDMKVAEDARKEIRRPSKRSKKARR